MEIVPKNELSYTDPEVVVRVYKIARILSNILQQHDIPFWTSGGTTLGWYHMVLISVLVKPKSVSGIVRHGGLIPWDDDIDICIRQEARVIQDYRIFIKYCSGAS